MYLVPQSVFIKINILNKIKRFLELPKFEKMYSSSPEPKTVWTMTYMTYDVIDYIRSRGYTSKTLLHRVATAAYCVCCTFSNYTFLKFII